MVNLQSAPTGTPPPDLDLDRVVDWWLRQRNGAERVAATLRQAFDEVLDGGRTGRYRYTELEKTEKTYVGTKVEILLRDEFALPRGPLPKRLDFGIEGVGVDCKYTQDNSWMIPNEAVGELCLLVTASDVTNRCSVGLLRCTLERLRGGANRDQKRSIKSAARAEITWLWREVKMAPSPLAQLSPAALQAIFALPGKGNGQARINELFRRVQRRIVPRDVVVTVARQADPMKRVRDARGHLHNEGVVILGHQKQGPRVAADLQLPLPHKGEFVACRLTPATPALQRQHRPATVVGGSTWVLAEGSDPVLPGPFIDL